MLTNEWQKSSRSGAQSQCVEARHSDMAVEVRDSKLGDRSPILAATPADWFALVGDIKQS
jgi:hypothetical protein